MNITWENIATWQNIMLFVLAIIVGYLAGPSGFWKFRKKYHTGGYVTPTKPTPEAIRVMLGGKLPVLSINGEVFVDAARPVALEAMALLDQRSKRCAAYLLTAVDYLSRRPDSSEHSSHVLVSRQDLQKWQRDWVRVVGDGDDTDTVTPFDHYLYF